MASLELPPHLHNFPSDDESHLPPRPRDFPSNEMSEIPPHLSVPAEHSESTLPPHLQVPSSYTEYTPVSYLRKLKANVGAEPSSIHESLNNEEQSIAPEEDQSVTPKEEQSISLEEDSDLAESSTQPMEQNRVTPQAQLATHRPDGSIIRESDIPFCELDYAGVTTLNFPSFFRIPRQNRKDLPLKLQIGELHTWTRRFDQVNNGITFTKRQYQMFWRFQVEMSAGEFDVSHIEKSNPRNPTKAVEAELKNFAILGNTITPAMRALIAKTNIKVARSSYIRSIIKRLSFNELTNAESWARRVILDFGTRYETFRDVMAEAHLEFRRTIKTDIPHSVTKQLHQAANLNDLGQEIEKPTMEKETLGKNDGSPERDNNDTQNQEQPGDKMDLSPDSSFVGTQEERSEHENDVGNSQEELKKLVTEVALQDEVCESQSVHTGDSTESKQSESLSGKDEDLEMSPPLPGFLADGSRVRKAPSLDPNSRTFAEVLGLKRPKKTRPSLSSTFISERDLTGSAAGAQAALDKVQIAKDAEFQTFKDTWFIAPENDPYADQWNTTGREQRETLKVKSTSARFPPILPDPPFPKTDEDPPTPVDDVSETASTGQQSSRSFRPPRSSVSLRNGSIIGASAPRVGETISSQKGRNLLTKMGWKYGTALGSENGNKGHMNPPDIVIKTTREGLR